MSELTYTTERGCSRQAGGLAAWGDQDPAIAAEARLEAGMLLRRLQRGELLSLPHSRPMPGIGRRCHELRVRDGATNWRIVYRTDRDAIVIGEVFAKKTRTTPKDVIVNCQRRFREYDDACK